MEKSAFSIVFMGTPDFAAGVLQKLISENITIRAVITAPDKPAGRGQQLHQSAVKQLAIAHQLTILQPANLKHESFQNELKQLQADLFVVVAFRMLPESVWSMPPKGTINLHASLLPQYRGAAPINWAIINGEKTTGVTTFFIEKEIDTGKVIEQESVEIGPEMNVGELHDLLLDVGARLIYSTVEKIRLDQAHGIPQSEFKHIELKAAPKIFKEDCRVQFDQTAKSTHDHIRGLSPYPAAWTKIRLADGSVRQFKLFRSEVTDLATHGDIYIKQDNNGLLFPCTDTYIRITELQPEGKRRMHYKEFLAGNTLEGAQIEHS